MKRSVSTLVALACTLALVAGPTSTVGATEAPRPTALFPSDVVGSGPGTVLGCIGCVAGGVMIAASGPVGWFRAVVMPGSTLALAGCIATCVIAAVE